MIDSSCSLRRFLLIGVLLPLGAAVPWLHAAQPSLDPPDALQHDLQPPADLSRFTMARVRYDSVGGMGEAFYYFEGRVSARWETHFPQAEENFVERLAELTSIEMYAEPQVRRLTDPDLGDYPMLFMSDPGYLRFDEAESAAQGAYLRNGGFLWVDDFWGDAEWLSFERLMVYI